MTTTPTIERWRDALPRGPGLPGAPHARRVLLPAVLLALLAGGCPRQDQKPAGTGQLTVHMEVEPAHLVSMIQPDFWAKRITGHSLFESLIRINPRTSRVEGELAASWQVSADGKRFTFHLRPGVRWHDGAPFSGQDVKVTFDRLLDEKVRATSTRATLEPYLEGYRLAAPDRFEITCKARSPFFMVALADLDILPAHLIGEGDLNSHPFLRSPVGTGPYRLDRWTRGREIVLSRWEGYWGHKPRIPRVAYRLVSSPDVALKLALRGELDFISRVRPEHWVGLVRSEPRFSHEFVKVRHFPPGISYVMFNHKRPMFQDLRVRRALARLLDMDTVLRDIMHGIGQRVGALYWFRDPDYNKDLQPIPFDPQGAGKLLVEAGYSDSDGDGVLDRGGVPLRFTFLVVAASKTTRRWLTLYQQALRKAGVKMEISPIDWSAYLDRLRAHDFDAAGMGMRQMGPFTDLYYHLHSSQMDDGQNYSAFGDPAVDRLLEQVRTEMDGGKRHALSLELQRIIAGRAALIPLYAEEEPGLVNRRVHGVYTSAMWYQVRDWWISE